MSHEACVNKNFAKNLDIFPFNSPGNTKKEKVDLIRGQGYLTEYSSSSSMCDVCAFDDVNL